MRERHIKVIAATGERCTKETWEQIAEGKCNIVLAAPEAIFETTGYFWNHVLWKRSSVLYLRIVAISIDECHYVKNWGGAGLRLEYNNIGILREAFPNIPFLSLTATMTPTGASYFFKSTRFKWPATIKQTIYWRNVDIWVARITGDEYEDLHVLFSDLTTYCRLKTFLRQLSSTPAELGAEEWPNGWDRNYC
jgi:superfamily II DNA helicase RecQ